MAEQFDHNAPHAETAKRIRAARAYAVRTQEALMEILEVSKPVVVEIEAGRRRVKKIEREAIADALGVPRWFLLHGWQQPEAAEGGIAGLDTEGPADSLDSLGQPTGASHAANRQKQ
jgi:transcriptional regulator with XRE-family HTH domain